MELRFERLQVGEPRHDFIHAQLSRAKVPGGWFVCIIYVSSNVGGPSMVFYPDPEHKWDGGSLPHDISHHQHAHAKGS